MSEPGEGGRFLGYLSVDKVAGGVHIHGVVDDLPPGRHGLHVRVDGCDGEHLNPDGKRHGGLDDAESHAGDLGNITVGADGSVDIDITTAKMTYDHGGRGILDLGLVISSGEDDETTQPDGGAGAAIACGSIAIPGE